MKNAINWFEIPSTDLERAKKFYETVLEIEMSVMEVNGMKSAFFDADYEGGSIGGCLIQGKGYEPSTSGSLIYLNGGEDLAAALGRVEAAGGKITLPKTAIGAHGFMAYFTDSEGNKLAFHSRQ